MIAIPARYIDQLNIALIGLTCIAAHCFPYHLLILSYAILGPAHYLTQISWLHDRRYFASSPFAAQSFVLLTILIMLVPGQVMSGVWLSLALGIALAFTLPPRWPWRAAGLLVGVALTELTAYFGPVALFLAVLLPTVMHVFVFTACFMCVGALRTGHTSAWLALLALLVGAATFLLSPGTAAMPDLDGLGFFQGVVSYMQSLLHISGEAQAKLFGFLSFAYTYHYLNWFSKAEIIRWHHIPRRRLVAIVMIYAASLAAYAYDYKTGFFLLLFLSLLHVLLEFPLNMRTFATLASALKR